MLRRQGLPPSCPHPEKWLVPVELPVSLLPGFTDIGQLRFMPRQRRSGRHQRRKTFPPPWNIAPAPASPFMRKSGAGPKGGFKKAGHRASLRAVRVEGTTALLRRAKGFGPLAAGGASFFTPRAAAIPPQDGYLRSVPQAGNAASGRSHTCTRQDSRDPRSRPRGPHAADSAP